MSIRLAVLDPRQFLDADPCLLGEVAGRQTAVLAPNPYLVLAVDHTVDELRRDEFFLAGCKTLVEKEYCAQVFLVVGQWRLAFQ